MEHDKYFHVQDKIFLGNKKTLLSKKDLNEQEKRQIRYWKNVGLGFTTPKTAIDGTYVDRKCPFTSDVSIRGRILQGIVKSTKMNRTVVVRREFLRYIGKFNRYFKSHTNLSAHVSPAFDVREGDLVVVGQCRPLAKTVKFNVLKVVPKGAKKAFQDY